MKLQLLAAPLLMALILSPMFAAAATGTISFSSPAAGASFTGTAAYTITGTISPVPSLPDNVVITVTAQGGVSAVDEQTVAVGAGGTFSYATNAGGSAAWVTGTYVITAFDSNGATGTTTFKYTSVVTPPQAAAGTAILIYVSANSLVYAGQTVQAEAMLVWNTNGTLVTTTNTTVTTTLVPPSGSSTTLTALASSTRGQYLYSYTVPAGSSDGAYLLQVVAKHTTAAGSFIGWGLGSFTVNSQVASASSISALSTSIAGITSSITALGTSVTSANNGIASLNTAVTSLQGTVGTINTAVTGLSSSVSGLTTTVNGLSSTVSGISSSLGTISSSISTLQSSVQGVSSSISTLTSDVTTLQSTVGGIQTTVNGLSGLSGQMSTLSSTLTTSMSGLQTSVSSLSSSVSNEQTYILVVAALAVITLVLELAILIRKMS